MSVSLVVRLTVAKRDMDDIDDVDDIKAPVECITSLVRQMRAAIRLLMFDVRGLGSSAALLEAVFYRQTIKSPDHDRHAQ